MSKLMLRHIPPERWWRITQWELIEPLTVFHWSVPKGFVTDGASTPWLLMWLVSPTGKAMPAAIVHDYLLQKQSRYYADCAFLDAMRVCDIGLVRRGLMYAAVRLYSIAKGIAL